MSTQCQFGSPPSAANSPCLKAATQFLLGLRDTPHADFAYAAAGGRVFAFCEDHKKTTNRVDEKKWYTEVSEGEFIAAQVMFL